jgi:hypothetical protein
VARSGSSTPSQRPRFDRPDAHRLLDERRKAESLTDQDFESLRSWVEHGYAIVRDVVPEQDVEGMLRDLDSVWTASEPIENLVVEDIRLVQTIRPDWRTRNWSCSIGKRVRG